ncbi:hypothetical protein LXL04_029978 [Taraxacum kok-saghyz]
MSSDGGPTPPVIHNIPLKTPSLTLVQFPHSLKLSSTNYMSWKTQIEALLHGLDLYKFIDGTNLPPKPTVTVDGVSTPHTDYQAWFRQDRLLFGALVGTLSPSIVPLITNASSSLEAWQILSNTYASPSRGHIKQLQHRLKQSTKTHDQSITDYMQSVKTIVDELNILGKKMDVEDITDAVLNGLDSNSYKPVIDVVHARDNPISFHELHEKLINHELSLPLQQTNDHQTNLGTTAIKTPLPLFFPHLTSLGKCQFCFTKGHSLTSCYAFKNKYPQVALPSLPKPTHNNPQAHVMTTANYDQNSTWLFDSGASHHITNDLNALSLHAPYDGTDELVIGDGSALTITHVGSSILQFSNNSFTLTNVLCVPSISKNILHISIIILIEFFSFNFLIKDFKTNQILLRGAASRGVYELRSSSQPSAFHTQPNKSVHWHHRLGHPHFQVLQFLASIVPSIRSLKNNCNSCCINKSHKLPFHSSSLKSTSPLQLIFSDVWSSPVTSFDGFKYYIIFVDHFTKYTWIYPLKHKSDSLTTFIRFQHLVENYFQTKIKQLFSDNGGEYIKLASHLTSCGISHLTSPPHTPEHNGYAERRHRHIVETALSLLSHANMPVTFWSFAVTTASYLINRLPTTTLQNDSPYFRLFQKLPNYDKLRNFGCLAYPWLRPYSQHKLQSRSKPCIFIGYSESQSAYHLLDPLTNKIHTSRHVHFVEDPPPSDSNIPSPSSLENNHPPPPPENNHPPPPPENNNPPHPDHNQIDPPPPPHRVHKPNSKYHNNDFLLYHSITQPFPEPQTITQALKQPQWRKAMQEEHDALIRNQTWSLVPPESAPNLVGCKWVFELNLNPMVPLIALKHGFHQRPGLDYVETFSPVVKPASLRLILSLASSQNWCLRQLDINNAFLQGTLTESVYVCQPPRFIDPSFPHHKFMVFAKPHVLGIMNSNLFSSPPNLSVPCISDPSLFVRHSTTSPIYIRVYVDDIIITGPNSTDVSSFITSLANRFSLKDLGNLSYFLGVEVLPHPDGLFLSQSKYILDLLTKAKMSDCKPASTPLTPSVHLNTTDGTPLSNPTDYRSLVGALQYL